jgi:hypothetical protein
VWIGASKWIGARMHRDASNEIVPSSPERNYPIFSPSLLFLLLANTSLTAISVPRFIRQSLGNSSLPERSPAFLSACQRDICGSVQSRRSSLECPPTAIQFMGVIPFPHQTWMLREFPFPPAGRGQGRGESAMKAVNGSGPPPTHPVKGGELS